MRNFLLLIGFGFLVACGGTGGGANTGGKNLDEKKSILTGKEWRMAVEAIRPMKDSLKLEGRQIEIFDNSLKNLQFASIAFYPDSNLTVNLSNGEDMIGGRWMFDKTGENLFLSFTIAQPIPHHIDYMSEDSIVLGMDREAGILFPKILVPVTENMGLQKNETAPANDTTSVSGE